MEDWNNGRCFSKHLCKVEIEEKVTKLRKRLEEEGPYDIILGFSQGKGLLRGLWRKCISKFKGVETSRNWTLLWKSSSEFWVCPTMPHNAPGCIMMHYLIGHLRKEGLPIPWKMSLFFEGWDGNKQLWKYAITRWNTIEQVTQRIQLTLSCVTFVRSQIKADSIRSPRRAQRQLPAGMHIRDQRYDDLFRQSVSHRSWDRSIFVLNRIYTIYIYIYTYIYYTIYIHFFDWRYTKLVNFSQHRQLARDFWVGSDDLDW